MCEQYLHIQELWSHYCQRLELRMLVALHITVLIIR